MIKVLMIISEAPPVNSGIARVAEKLTQGLRSRGYHVDILSVNDIPRYEMGEIRLSSMPFKIAQLREKFAQYDVIHLHGPVPTFSDVFLLWGLRGMGKRRPKLVYTHHAPIDLKVPLLYPMIKTYNHLQERMANLADHVVVSTPSYSQRLSRYVPTHKLSVIPWGVEYNKFEAPVQKNGPFTVLYLGQIRPYKGLPVLLKAAAQQEGMRIWVIGDGHYAEACQLQSKELELEDITFWGRLPDDQVIDLVKKAHVVVLPSVTQSEAFGIALLEGMAAGLVPVASHLPGVADLIGNEGFTFQPGNHKDLRDILRRLRDDNKLRSHMATLAQAKARLYSWERSSYGYDRIFRNLLTSSPKAARYVGAEIPTSPVN